MNINEDIVVESSKTKNKKISLLSLILLLVGSIIGTGVFMSVDEIVKSMPSIFYSLMVWIICGLIALGAGLCYAELGTMFPSCGGEYAYFLRAYNDWFAFSFMFTNFLFIKPCSVAVIVAFFSKTCLEAAVTDVGRWPIAFFSVGCTILLCGLNCWSNYWSIKLNDVLTYSKFICLGILISLGIYKLCIGEFENVQDWGFRIPVTAIGISNSMNNGFWSYDGFNALSYMAEDIKHVKRDLLLASIIGMALVIAFYVITNFSYIVILGIDKIANSTQAAVVGAELFMGKWSLIIVILIAFSAFGTANATAFCGVRIYFDAARNGHLPKIVAGVHKKNNTMIPALIFQAILTCIFLLSVEDIKTLLMYFTLATWVYYTFAILSVIIFRYKLKIKSKGIQVPSIIILFLAAVSSSVVILGFIQDWLKSLVSVSLIIISLPVYVMFIHYGYKFLPRISKYIDYTTKVLLNLMHCEISETSLPS